MRPEVTLSGPAYAPATASWRTALQRLLAAWLGLGILTLSEWRAMGHQWWNIDTYNHIVLVPAILLWLVWLRRGELGKICPSGSWLGLAWTGVALAIWLLGRALELNLLAQAGVIGAFQGAALALLGTRASLLAAFPLAYAMFLVPFGDELIPTLQSVTAQIAIALCSLSGVPAVSDGLLIDTPAGRFVVAEECAGVKFLVAMVALSVLIGWTGFRAWKPRFVLVTLAALVSVLANGVRAWGTIFAAQYIGIERAGGFDHIIYGWVFFAIVIALVMGVAWRYFDREPEQAGLTAPELKALPLGWADRYTASADLVLAGVLFTAIVFAALAVVI